MASDLNDLEAYNDSVVRHRRMSDAELMAAAAEQLRALERMVAHSEVRTVRCPKDVYASQTPRALIDELEARGQSE